MALDFPSNPVNGQVYDNYFWDAATNAWRSSGSTSIPDFLTNATIGTSSLSDVPLRVDGVLSQAANLQEWRNSSGTVLSSISASGGLTLNNALTVGNGGTGATSLTSGAYLKGNGSNTIQAQSGIPATDITSGILPIERGGTGTELGSGLVPITPTSISNSAGTASVNADGSVTFTSVTSIGLNGIFSSSFRNYRVIYIVTGAFTQTQMYRFRTGGTDNSSANYYFNELYADAATIGASGNTAQTIGRIGYSEANFRATHIFDVINPFQTQVTEIFCNTGRSKPSVTYLVSGHTGATSFDGMNFFLNAGTGGSTGVLKVYGYR